MVTSRLLSRSIEQRAIADILRTARSTPASLILEGEAGIGKTTLWLATHEQAQELGFVGCGIEREQQLVHVFFGVADQGQHACVRPVRIGEHVADRFGSARAIFLVVPAQELDQHQPVGFIAPEQRSAGRVLHG